MLAARSTASAKSTVSAASTVSARSTASPQAHTYHGSASSINSLEEDVSPSNSTVSWQLNSPGQIRSQLMSIDMEDGCAPASTTSNESSPYNPCSVRQEEIMSQCGRTLSGSDLGYYSESSGSLRDRLTSTFTGYESETSSYVYESGMDASPHNLYSPDYPQSVLSNYSDGTFHSPTSHVTSPESHSQSPFHSPSSVHSHFKEPSPSYMLPADHCSSMDGSPPQFTQDNFVRIDRERPINFCCSEQREAGFGKAESLSPTHASSLDATSTTGITHQGFTGGKAMPQFNSKGFPWRPQYNVSQPPIMAHMVLSQRAQISQPTCHSG